MVSPAEDDPRAAEDARLAAIVARLDAFDRHLLSLYQERHGMAPAMQRSSEIGAGWEITKTGFAILASVSGILTLVASAAVAWTTSQNALAQKVDERRFERDSVSTVAESRETRAAIQQLQTEQREFRVEALQRLREICNGVRTGCR